jgi:aryl-alcohol dehydrogenase-like predicted oxidoreductase
VLADLKRQELIRNIGLSNLTAQQIDDCRKVTEIVCVQNQYNLVHRADDSLIDKLVAEQIASVPFCPLAGFSPIQFSALTAVAQRPCKWPCPGCSDVHPISC